DDDRWCIDAALADRLLRESTLVRQGVRHVLTHRVLLTDFYRLDTEEQPPLPADYHWVPESKLDDYAKPRLIELLFSDQSGTELK
ncbi:MAG: NUDIX domain-containing protein, partial [Prevotella sp.]|nr:NUDIX domain-containing protein [Prevotella sp.]